ncbi:DUF3427 domain-containing protein [Rhizobium beringeri]|uniref:DUF3427 domain-containing protein n=1 Tax=Rhizobium beringeri TaxID=3019934 RepID=UPI002E15F44C|nr:DUF3427 domain-containing protein [Rhizobium beringeri]
MFQGIVGEKYSREDVQSMLDVPPDKRGGNWDTGYTEWDGQFFIFCNVNVAGRTGHDYSNHWDGSKLVWQAKNGTNIRQPQMQRLLSGRMPVHVFHRHQDRAPFTYAGVGQPLRHENTSPVSVRWSFETQKRVADRRNVLREVLTERGFVLEAPRTKTQRAARGDLVTYLKIDSDAYPLVLGPEWVDWLTDFELAGAERPANRLFYHNSTMRAFPRKVHTGTDAIPFGIDFRFPSREVFQRFLDVLLDTPTPIAEGNADGRLETVDVDPRTETETTRAARLKQSKFRRDLLDRHNGKCMITRIDMPDLLRASHIKPWARSTGKERIDPENGLLLAVHLDGLFDKGLISFDMSGRILISEKVSPVTRAALGLNPEWHLEEMGQAQSDYMSYHRTKVFVDAAATAAAS